MQFSIATVAVAGMLSSAFAAPIVQNLGEVTKAVPGVVNGVPAAVNGVPETLQNAANTLEVGEQLQPVADNLDLDAVPSKLQGTVQGLTQLNLQAIFDGVETEVYPKLTSIMSVTEKISVDAAMDEVDSAKTKIEGMVGSLVQALSGVEATLLAQVGSLTGELSESISAVDVSFVKEHMTVLMGMLNECQDNVTDIFGMDLAVEMFSPLTMDLDTFFLDLTKPFTMQMSLDSILDMDLLAKLQKGALSLDLTM